MELELEESVAAGGREEVDTDELVLFRHQWREELGLQGGFSGHKDTEDEAASLYWMGVAAERSGDMHAALLFYKKAVQLVPDIEFRVEVDEKHKEQEAGVEEHECHQEFSDDNQLVEVFRSLSLGVVCQAERPCRETHISALPVEIIRYILRWVVSDELDLRSLEQFSMVCRGFYMSSRDQALWRSACKRLWGECSPSAHGGIWRNMFVHKAHLHFNGVYISKTSYVRPGERSLDGYYKPYHTVVYYRYLRFFADGSVMYQTSPLEPAMVVGKLCLKHSSEAVLLGHYTMQGNMVSVDVVSHMCQRLHHHRRAPLETTHEQHFYMDLMVNGGIKFNKLDWKEHYCHSLHKPTRRLQVTQFTIDYKYTPFYFSRVKSFSMWTKGLLK